MPYKKTAQYYELFHPEKEGRIRCVEEILNRHPIHDVLDSYCRTGTVAISLAEKKYNVSAIDKNKDILHFFRQKIRGKRLNIDIKQISIEKMEYNEDFDAVLSLKSSLIHITDTECILTVLKKMREALREGGILVLEFVNFLSYLKNFEPEETLFYQKENLNLMRYIKRDVEDVPGILIQSEFGVIGGNGSADSYYETERMKILTYEESINLLQTAGFKKIESYDNYSLEELDKKAERFIFVAEK